MENIHKGATLRRLALAVVMLLAGTAGVAGKAQAWGLSIEDLKPTGMLLQAGKGGTRTHNYAVGVIWDWRWSRQFSFGTFTGYNEASFGRWVIDHADGRASSWSTQVGITPVLRLQPARWNGRWFFELGIGANVILPIYQNDQKRFSTEFNFGDHVAVGRFIGKGQRHEIALRGQHYSNAGIDKPNPGENFAMLRYTWHF